MNGGQSKKGSLVESLANIAAGVSINFVINVMLFHYYGWAMTWEQNAKITALFTCVSLVRSFVLRRVFNKLTTRKTDVSIAALAGRWEAELTERWNNVAPDGRCQ